MPSSTPSLSVAVIGAGMSGLRAASQLQSTGSAKVRVFDKARGVGGRTSLRRADPHAFDHGAQYFTARDARFREQVDAWVEAGIAAPYQGRLAGVPRDGSLQFKTSDTTERFVGVPGMNAMAKAMAEDLDVSVRSRVTGLDRSDTSWSLSFEDGRVESGFDAVLVTTPSPQAAPLVGTASAKLIAICERAPMTPCWAAMIAFEEPFDAPFDGVFIDEGPVTWACRNSQKPGRPAGDAWVLHASPAWTEEHLDVPAEQVAEALGQALARAANTNLPPVAHASAHRWMYSAAREPLDDVAAFDETCGLGLAGDWLNGSKVQGAWLSGDALAGLVLQSSLAR
ncbi:MAG: FAD-dependent oxidoreductase [Planctomycetota bacterium]